MANLNDQQRIVAELEHDWPNFQVWVVGRAYGGPVWCARRWDGTEDVLNAASPDELTDMLEEAASGEQ